MSPTGDAAPAAGRRPRSTLEYFLIRTWEQVLESRPIGVTDDFYARGGDSVQAAEILAAVEEHTGVRLPLNELDACPTVEGLAAAVERYAQQRMIGTVMDVSVERDASGETGGPEAERPVAGRPMFLFDPMEMLSGLSSIELLRRIDPKYPRYIVKSVLLRPRRTISSMEQLIGPHVDSIMRVYPDGPLRLAGVCSGGYVAVGVADALRRRGREVELVMVIHAGHPTAYARRAQRRLVGVLAGAMRRGLLPPRVAAELFLAARVLRAVPGSVRASDPRSAREVREHLAGLRYRVRTLQMGLRDWVCASYELPHWPGRLVYVAALEPDGDPRDVPDGWERVAAQLEVVRGAWRYRDLYSHCREIGGLLDERLCELDGRAAESSAALEPAIAGA